jgi:hypothetical protein
MPDLNFTVQFQPSDPAEHAARMAVLYRLYAPGPNRSPYPRDMSEWESAFTRILELWRRRVTELQNLGAHRFGVHQVQRARNCHPWGIAVKSYRQAVRYCRHPVICPWCACREAGTVYTSVRRVLRKDDALASLTCTEFVGGEVTRASLHRQLEWGRKILRGLALANSETSRAATWNMVLEPPTFHRGHKHEFCLRYRCLMIMPAHEPTILAPTAEGWTNVRCHNPSEKDIQRTIARVCAYPVGMLTGSAEATQLVLEARAGLRLSEMMGALRGLPTEVVPEAPLQY